MTVSIRKAGPDDASFLAWVMLAAVQKVRRRGIISLLLQEAIDRGKAKGFKKAQIGVFIGNMPARKAYEKAGFRFVDDKRTPEFKATYGDEGIARLVMEYDK
ncbi:MAG: GNAT family N-acetyltransferase [Deltaproteobacteria bacterium]|nr:GNAT family N-acetyltransferase [Deltaproteobacteria bacterium]